MQHDEHAVHDVSTRRAYTQAPVEPPNPEDQPKLQQNPTLHSPADNTITVNAVTPAGTLVINISLGSTTHKINANESSAYMAPQGDALKMDNQEVQFKHLLLNINPPGHAFPQLPLGQFNPPPLGMQPLEGHLKHLNMPRMPGPWTTDKGTANWLKLLGDTATNPAPCPLAAPWGPAANGGLGQEPVWKRGHAMPQLPPPDKQTEELLKRLLHIDTNQAPNLAANTDATATAQVHLTTSAHASSTKKVKDHCLAEQGQPTGDQTTAAAGEGDALNSTATGCASTLVNCCKSQ